MMEGAPSFNEEDINSTLDALLAGFDDRYMPDFDVSRLQTFPQINQNPGPLFPDQQPPILLEPADLLAQPPVQQLNQSPWEQQLPPWEQPLQPALPVVPATTFADKPRRKRAPSRNPSNSNPTNKELEAELQAKLQEMQQLEQRNQVLKERLALMEEVRACVAGSYACIASMHSTAQHARTPCIELARAPT